MISDYIKENGCDYIITGKLSNILVLDGGYDGVVINTKNLKGIDIEENLICAGSGEKLAKVVNMAAERGLSGLEKLCGIPGTVGGAVCMNSGCFGADMSMAVEKVYLFDMNKQERVVKDKKQMGFAYRKSAAAKGNYAVIGARLELEEKNLYDIKNTMRSVIAVRRENQPSLPSLGSVYKRVGNTAAAIFIEGAGLKGYRVNDMEVSAVHANFIVNKGNGKADDYLTIMEHIEEKVYARYGIKLEREVFVVGKRA